MNNAWRLPLRLITTIILVAIGILIILLPSLLRRQRMSPLRLSAATTFTDSTVVPAGTPPPESAAVMAALSHVIDPEVGISVIDLGLVDSLHIDSLGNVSVILALTTPECPVVSQIGKQAASAVVAVPGVRKVRVQLDPSLPWDPSRLSRAARELYRKRFGNR